MLPNTVNVASHEHCLVNRHDTENGRRAVGGRGALTVRVSSRGGGTPPTSRRTSGTVFRARNEMVGALLRFTGLRKRRTQLATGGGVARRTVAV